MRERNIILNLVLTVITCGLYGLYWQASVTNELQEKTGRKVTASGGLAALYSFVTCSIYFFYWLYKTGALVSELREERQLPPDAVSHENYIISALVALAGSVGITAVLGVIVVGLVGASADGAFTDGQVGELAENIVSMAGGLMVNLVLALVFILLVVKRKKEQSSSLLLMLAGLLMTTLLLNPLLALGFLQKSLNGLSFDNGKEVI